MSVAVVDRGRGGESGAADRTAARFAQATTTRFGSRRISEDTSGFKVLELFVVAMGARLSADDLKSMLFGYPTSVSDVPYMV